MNGQELRPMGIGDILDTTFRLYRQRFLAFLVIALVCYVPYALFMAALPVVAPAEPPARPYPPHSYGQNPFDTSSMGQQGESPFGAIHPAAFLPLALGTALFVLVIFPLCQAAMTHNISASYLGETLSAGDSYARAAPRLLPLLWTNLLVMLAVWLGLAMCLVPGIIFGLWFMLAVPVVVLEQISGPKAMGRSRKLMRGNINKGFVLMFVVGILGGVLNVALGAVIGFIPWPHHAIRIFFANVVPALILPIQTAPLILLYYDLRIRKEAFDLQRLAETLGQATATQ